MRNHLRSFLTLAGATALVAAAAAWADGPVYMNPGDIKWGDAPPNLPKGGKMAVLSGDPGKDGWFVARLQMPAGYKIAPHWHSQDEDLTVVSGTMYLAEGDKMETAHAHGMKPGAFHHLPAKTHHYAYTKTATVVQINGKGPFDIVYIDAKDDPSKAAPAAPAAPKK
jgi:hypothetical protein